MREESELKELRKTVKDYMAAKKRVRADLEKLKARIADDKIREKLEDIRAYLCKLPPPCGT